jgi:hypothetical protein
MDRPTVEILAAKLIVVHEVVVGSAGRQRGTAEARRVGCAIETPSEALVQVWPAQRSLRMRSDRARKHRVSSEPTVL